MQYEWIGILGSVMIIIAFTNKNEKLIRILDCIGASLFIIYGFLTHTWATVFLNLALMVVHIVRFIQMRKEKENGK